MFISTQSDLMQKKLRIVALNMQPSHYYHCVFIMFFVKGEFMYNPSHDQRLTTK